MPIALSSFLAIVAIYIILTWAVYLVYRAGQLYNAPIFTMAIGAYCSAYLVRDLSWPFGLALIAAVGLGAFCAFILALGLARLGPFAVAIATIAFIFITQTVIRNLWFLGGSHGFFKIPQVEYLLPIMYVAVVIAGFFIYRLDHSRLGRAMEVVFVDPEAADSLGIDRYRLRVFLQVVAGAMGALAGVFYAFSFSTIQVPAFGFHLLLYVYCFLFVGGCTTMWGSLVFTPILWAISVFLPEDITVFKDIIFGTLLILVLTLRPQGIIDKKVVRAASSKSRVWLSRFRKSS